MDKLRLDIISTMKAQDVEMIQSKSAHICETLKNFMKPGMIVGTYMAMKEEVQLYELLTLQIPNVKWAIPKIAGKGHMSFYLLEHDTIFEANHWGILEPVDAVLIKPDMFDVMLVPLVGFDEQKHRIGHGQGYYDRYLANCNALKIGIAFEFQKCERIQKQEHDIDMDIIITEKQIYE